MRITFVLRRADLGGGTRVVATHAEHLAARGHRVCVVSVAPARHDLRTHLRALVREHRWLTPPSRESHLDGRPMEHRRLGVRRSVLDRDVPEADVVVATWWETAEWVARMSPSRGAKAYLVQDHEVFDYLPVARARATYALPLKKIVVSRWLEDVMQREYGDRSVALVPNGVDTRLFSAPARERGIKPRVGIQYSLAPRKGTDLGFRAWEMLRSRVPGASLVVLSAERPEPSLPIPRGAELHVRPSQQRIAELYASCDVWLFPSRSEGFGLPLLEAMASRTPVVAAPAGAAPELVRGGAGVLVARAAPDDLAEGLERVLRLDREQWRAMSEQAHRTAMAHDWESSSRAFEGVVEDLARRSERGVVAFGATDGL